MIAGVLCGAAAQREVAVVEMASGGDGRRRRRMATATDGVEAAASGWGGCSNGSCTGSSARDLARDL